MQLLPLVAVLFLCGHFNGVSLHPQSSPTNRDENESRKALLDAINAGNVDEVRRLVVNGVNVNATNQHGWSALMLATIEGSEEIVQMLIEKGANINAVNDDNDSALTYAAYTGHESIVRLLIENKADIDALNMYNESALIRAIIKDHDKIAELLIQKGANVNVVAKSGTALTWAAQRGQENIARFLIHNGVDLTLKNIDGKTAKDLATERGFHQLARVLQENVAQKACDLYSNLPVTRILGGEGVESDTDFPWTAALGYVNSDLKVGFNCAGTLISDKFVLTAAHCVKRNNQPVVVRLGQIDLNNDNTEKIAENHHIEEIIRHPDYSPMQKTNDIALIELANRVFLSESIRPACLQTYLRDENANIDLTVTGWGIVDPKSRTRPSTLLKATLKTVPSTECSTILANHFEGSIGTPFRNGTLQSHYCAVDPNHVSDTCEGDSGGALQIVRSHRDSSTVVGVVSTGVPCGTTLPGIYTRVAHFIDWIESHVWPNGAIAAPQINQASLYN